MNFNILIFLTFQSLLLAYHVTYKVFAFQSKMEDFLKPKPDLCTVQLSTFTMYFTKIFFVVPKSHKHFHPSSVVPLCKAAVKGLNNLSTQHALKTLFLASFVNRFYCWNIEVVYEVSRSPWRMCPWNTMKSVPACVKMILTDLRHV